MADDLNRIESFRFMVKLFIASNSPTVIGNSSPAHAKVLLEEMFNAARKTAFVYCGCISEKVWGGDAIANAVRGALEREVDVRFIVQHADQIPPDSAIFKLMQQHGGIVTSPRFAEINSHFAVFDGKMYRFEKNDEAKTADACMNDPEWCAKLEEVARAMVAAAA